MCISNSDTEKRIKSYYKDKYRIERLQARINMLSGQLADVITDIDNSNITLYGEIPAIDYSSEKIQASAGGASVQENEVERAFLCLERQKEKLEAEIFELKTEMRDLEKNAYDMEHIIGLLKEEAQQFIELRYRRRKSLYYIGEQLNMSVSSVSRLREAILRDISNWIYTLS